MPDIEKLLSTSRIFLRRWKEDDAEALYRYASDKGTGFLAGWPAHKSAKESRHVIRTVLSNDTTWAIMPKDTAEPIGCICYYTHETSNIGIGTNDCEIGFWIGRPYWSKGICTEALHILISYCRNVMHFENIYADYYTGNAASFRVLERCGFRDTGLINSNSNLPGSGSGQVRILKLDLSK